MNREVLSTTAFSRSCVSVGVILFCSWGGYSREACADAGTTYPRLCRNNACNFIIDANQYGRETYEQIRKSTESVANTYLHLGTAEHYLGAANQLQFYIRMLQDRASEDENLLRQPFRGTANSPPHRVFPTLDKLIQEVKDDANILRGRKPVDTQLAKTGELTLDDLVRNAKNIGDYAIHMGNHHLQETQRYKEEAKMEIEALRKIEEMNPDAVHHLENELKQLSFDAEKTKENLGIILTQTEYSPARRGFVYTYLDGKILREKMGFLYNFDDLFVPIEPELEPEKMISQARKPASAGSSSISITVKRDGKGGLVNPSSIYLDDANYGGDERGGAVYFIDPDIADAMIEFVNTEYFLSEPIPPPSQGVVAAPENYQSPSINARP